MSPTHTHIPRIVVVFALVFIGFFYLLLCFFFGFVDYLFSHTHTHTHLISSLSWLLWLLATGSIEEYLLILESAHDCTAALVAQIDQLCKSFSGRNSAGGCSGIGCSLVSLLSLSLSLSLSFCLDEGFHQ